VELIRGPKDTVVRLEVLPEDEGVGGPTRVVDIVRDEVKLEEQAAQSEIIEVPMDESGDQVVKIGVIDLRNNGGGSLLEATTLTGLFIDRGPVVQVRNSSGRISLEEDNEAGMAWSGPLAVLVNRYSASASEIFAAAIQDYGRGVVVGETTFGKGTVQSLLDLNDYASADRPGLGQLKITMAQFFRVNGGSTQNRGVVPDIAFPSAGDPEDYGERSLDNALPWTRIDPARYQAAGDLSELVAVAESRYRERVVDDQEFAWLRDDIAEFNEHADEKRISLLESEGRERIAKREAKKKEREGQDGSVAPLVEEENVLATADAELEDGDQEVADDAEEDEGPDLLLRETARIVADMAELGADLDLLKEQFAQLSKTSSDEDTLH
ncbi:MAG: carboxy terminal-processing peptidase, partial [Gammaproteobacteria bacterium]